jgi:hypothetical protein
MYLAKNLVPRLGGGSLTVGYDIELGENEEYSVLSALSSLGAFGFI